MRLSFPLETIHKLFGQVVKLGYNGTVREFRIEGISKSSNSSILLNGHKFTPTSVEPRTYRLDKFESLSFKN